MYKLSFYIFQLLIITIFGERINRIITNIELGTCENSVTECLSKSPYVIRQFNDQSVISWNEGRALCHNANDDEVDGMATLDLSNKATSDTSLDDQFNILREECRKLRNNDGRAANCWVGGKLNENEDGYTFHSQDTNRNDYTPILGDPARWGCVRNTDGSCKKDIEGMNLKNGENYLCLFQNRNYFLADWPKNGGTNPDFQVTAVVCNSKKFSYFNRCQCFCDSCDIYGDPHINTFDGVQFHTKGQCAYHAVTPCNTLIKENNGNGNGNGNNNNKVISAEPDFDEDFPIEISTENIECFNGFSSCLYSLFVSFYAFDGKLQTVIKFEHSNNNGNMETVVNYINEGALKLSGSVEMDSAQTWIANPSNDNEPWSFLLTKKADNYELGIWTTTKYQTARIQFRDLSGLNTNSLYLSISRIILSSCFAGKTCGICGYYDDDTTNELIIRDTVYGQLTAITTNDKLSNPFDTDTIDIISQFTDAWINYPRSTKSDTQCNINTNAANLCELHYCNDECICDATEGTVTTYNGNKQQQCNYDLAACLGITADSTECIEWQNNDAKQRERYIKSNAMHCFDLVNTYCCYEQFCSGKPDFCNFSIRPTKQATKRPSDVPTPGPTREPTDKPTQSPTIAPTAGPTHSPTDPPPTKRPSAAPIKHNLCTDASGLDIMFLVDNSCGLPMDECIKQQDGISELIASIKDAADPRIGYITFDIKAEVLIDLEDIKYNDIINNKFGVRNRKQLINIIKGFDCGTSDTTDLLKGLDAAMEALSMAVTPTTKDRDRKIVIVNNCEDNINSIDPCSLLEGDVLLIEDKRVEITVINIPSTKSQAVYFNANKYLQCLAEDEPERLITIKPLNAETFDAVIPQFVTAVCENDTPSPTNKPTVSPIDPTFKPTENPSKTPITRKPTHSPLEGPCGFNYIADIVFVVDASCGFNEKQCMKQQDLISDIMQSVKTSNQPRVSYIDCDDTLSGEPENALLIRLNDAVFNHPNKLPDEDSLRALYFEMIGEKTRCNVNANTVPRMECINMALDELKTFSKQNKKKKLVIYSACAANDDVCSLKERVKEDDIEVILINIGQENDENMCLLRETDQELIYKYPNLEFNQDVAKDITVKVTDAICQEPTTQPTNKPTTAKPTTAKPTDKPTDKPTVKPTAKPTTTPTEGAANIIPPTSSPLESVCDFNGDADIMFVVDSTCGLDEKTCITKRKFISDLVQSIKITHNPRIALLECGDTFGTQYTIKLSDTSFNDINDDDKLSKIDRDELYFNKIQTRLQCLDGVGVPKRQCLNDAIDIFDSHDVDGDRIRKIVYIQICPNIDGQEACSKKIAIFNSNIEIILVNIGNLIPSNYNDCLLWDGPYNIYRFEDFDFKTTESIEIRQKLITHICTSNRFIIDDDSSTTTETPTVDLEVDADTTLHPTPEPTAEPTDKPTTITTTTTITTSVEPTSKPNWPTKKAWPTKKPSDRPTKWKMWPTEKPTVKKIWPTKKPTVKIWPTKKPTVKKIWPTKKPTVKKIWQTKKPTVRSGIWNGGVSNSNGYSDSDSDSYDNNNNYNYYYYYHHHHKKHKRSKWKNVVVDDVGFKSVDSHPPGIFVNDDNQSDDDDGDDGGKNMKGGKNKYNGKKNKKRKKNGNDAGKQYKNYRDGGIDDEFNGDTDNNIIKIYSSSSSNYGDSNTDFNWNFKKQKTQKKGRGRGWGRGRGHK